VTVTSTASDGTSGLGKVDLYAKAPGESAFAKVKTDATPGASGSFSYTAATGDGSYGFYTVATDKAGNAGTTSTVQSTTVVDRVAPTSSGAAPADSTSAPVRVSYSASDGGSGLATVDLYAKAPGQSAFAKVKTTATPGAAGSFSYTAGAADGSYAFYTVATDKAGNAETTSAAQSTTVLDRVVPTAQALATTNVASGLAGRADTGDTMTFTYSETMNLTSILAGWSGASTPVRVKLINGSSDDTLEVWTADGSARLPVANPVNLGGDYVPACGATFNAAMAASAGSAVKITLGSVLTGSVQAKAVKNGPLKWTPDSRATDVAGNNTSIATVTKGGNGF
jgi:hypothetical protein